jgi:hypothetical protein
MNVWRLISRSFHEVLRPRSDPADLPEQRVGAWIAEQKGLADHQAGE